MARIRSIKPEFWTDEKIVELSAFARLLFIGLWNFADDEGRMVLSVKRLKLQILPADSADVSELLGEIRGKSLVQTYVVDGVEYLQIVNFAKHQKVDRRVKSKHPEPPQSPPISPEPRRFPPTDQGRDQGRDQGNAAPDGAPVVVPMKSPEARVYDRGREVLGGASGGLVAKLIRHHGGNSALAMASIETASTKSDPREYVGRIIAGRPEDEARSGRDF